MPSRAHCTTAVYFGDRCAFIIEVQGNPPCHPPTHQRQPGCRVIIEKKTDIPTTTMTTTTNTNKKSEENQEEEKSSGRSSQPLVYFHWDDSVLSTVVRSSKRNGRHSLTHCTTVVFHLCVLANLTLPIGVSSGTLLHSRSVFLELRGINHALDRYSCELLAEPDREPLDQPVRKDECPA